MTPRNKNWPETFTGLGLIIAGLVMGWQASTIKVIAIYAKVGPAAFLWFVAATLIACGAIVIWRTPPANLLEKTDVTGPMAILLGLFQTVILFEPLGFILSSTILFWLTAWGLGSRRYFFTFIVGLILSSMAFAIFRFALDLRLPVGALFQ